MDDYKPTIRVTEKDFPAIKKYDVNGKYDALYSCRVIDKGVDDDGKYHATLEILKIKEVPHRDVSKVKSLIKGGSYD
jgi:hypothetical protein